MNKLVILLLLALAAWAYSSQLDCRPAEAKAHELAIGITCSRR